MKALSCSSSRSVVVDIMRGIDLDIPKGQMAAILTPSDLLADEPTGNLDPENGRQLLDR
jgi:ABC-type lipoprotein export system ATPase subunit